MLEVHNYLRFRLNLVQAEETVVIRAGDDAMDAIVHKENLHPERGGRGGEKEQNDANYATMPEQARLRGLARGTTHRHK